jgi:hypothetical protein
MLPACRFCCRREVLARWRAYFHFKLAEHSMTHQGAEVAVEQLEGLAEGGGLRLAPEEQVLQLLCRATLHLLAGDVTATSATLEEINPLIEAGGSSSGGGAGGEGGAASGGGGSLLYKQLRCHYQVLHVSMVVVAGRINDLKQGGCACALLPMPGVCNAGHRFCRNVAMVGPDRDASHPPLLHSSCRAAVLHSTAPTGVSPHPCLAVHCCRCQRQHSDAGSAAEDAGQHSGRALGLLLAACPCRGHCRLLAARLPAAQPGKDGGSGFLPGSCAGGGGAAAVPPGHQPCGE